MLCTDFYHEYVLLRSLLHSYDIEKGGRRKQRSTKNNQQHEQIYIAFKKKKGTCNQQYHITKTRNDKIWFY